MSNLQLVLEECKEPETPRESLGQARDPLRLLPVRADLRVLDDPREPVDPRLKRSLPVLAPEEPRVLEAPSHDPLVPPPDVPRGVAIGVRHRQERRPVDVSANATMPAAARLWMAVLYAESPMSLKPVPEGPGGGTLPVRMTPSSPTARMRTWVPSGWRRTRGFGFAGRPRADWAPRSSARAAIQVAAVPGRCTRDRRAGGGVWIGRDTVFFSIGLTPSCWRLTRAEQRSAKKRKAG